MANLKLALAQSFSHKGKVEDNINQHIRLMTNAQKVGATVVVFPELSLTGYEPELAAQLAFSVDDPRLEPLREAAIQLSIYALVGAPIIIKQCIYIGVFILCPDGTVSHYLKMHLHDGEEVCFEQGNQPVLIDVEGKRIALAICADVNHPAHAQSCAGLGADVYLAGVLISEQGWAPDLKNLITSAKANDLLIGVANHSRSTGGWQSCGNSAFIDDTGVLEQANCESQILVLAESVEGRWQTSKIVLEEN